MGIFTPDTPEPATPVVDSAPPAEPDAPESDQAPAVDDAPEDLGEFDSSEQRDAHVAALEAELAGQQQRAETPEAGEVHVKSAERRIPHLIEELERITKRTRLRGDAR